jgi:flagellar hook-length control protein FliK
MVSTNQVTSHTSPKVVIPSFLGQSPQEAPETGEFDFLNYFLGLQGTSSPAVSTTEDAAAALTANETLLSATPVGSEAPTLKGSKDDENSDPNANALMVASLMPATRLANPLVVNTSDPATSVANPGMNLPSALTSATTTPATVTAGNEPGTMPGQNLFAQTGKLGQELAAKPLPSAEMPTPASIAEKANGKTAENKLAIEATSRENATKEAALSTPDLSSTTSTPMTSAKATETRVDARYEANSMVTDSGTPTPKSNVLGNHAAAFATNSQTPVTRDQALQKYDVVARYNPNANPTAPAYAAAPSVNNAGQSMASEAEGMIPVSRKGDRKDDAGLMSGLDLAITTNKATASAAPTPNQSATETSAKATVPELMNQVGSMVRQGGGKMVVSLNPPELGRVEVSVIAKGKKIEVEMKSDTEKTKSLLQGHVSDLKDSMQAQDLFLSKMEVSVNRETQHQPSDTQFNGNHAGNQFSGDFREFAQREGSAGSKQPVVGTRNVSGPARLPIATASASRSVGATGRVDMRI